MSDREAEHRKQLEEEAGAWVKKEYERRFACARETLEQQGRESEHHLKMMGINDTSRIASETQMSISHARTEILKDVQFEADNWVEAELKKRLEKESQD
jgi:hypothetical protein